MRAVAVVLVFALSAAGCAGPPGAGSDPDPDPGPGHGETPPKEQPDDGGTGRALPKVPVPGQPAPSSTDAPRPAPKVQVDWDDGLSIIVPLDVVLLGFSDAVATGLAERFAGPYGRDHVLLASHGRYDLENPGIPGGGYSYPDLPMEQAVQVRVHPVDELASYLEAVGEGTMRDGNAAQTWAAKRLPHWGLADALVPPLVLVHAGERGHSYRVDFPNGYWDEARVLGGAERVLVMDLSAGVDPYTGDDMDFMEPIAADDLDAIEEAVQQAARFRLMHGPLYALPTKPCHAITLVYAVHTTGEVPVTGGISADEAFHPEVAEAAFRNLTREVVHVDPVRLELPADDPALWSLVRMQTTGFATLGIGEYESREMTRAWITDNWERYHVPHDGCEEYLSLLVWSDTFEQTAYGIASFDGEGRRFSFSLVPEFVRGFYEPGLVTGTCCKPDSIYGFALVDMLFVHETGHLFGQAHPHNALDGKRDHWAFSSTTTTMSYLTDERDVSFGAIDPHNWDRNRLAFLAEALETAGAKDAAIDAGFLDAIAAGDFTGAAAIAQGLL